METTQQKTKNPSDGDGKGGEEWQTETAAIQSIESAGVVWKSVPPLICANPYQFLLASTVFFESPQ